MLAAGVLPLPAVLLYAGDIATELRSLHEQSRAYGGLSPLNVLVTESGVRLLPSNQFLDGTAQGHDVQAFGALLYQMLTRKTPPVSLKAADIRSRGERSGPSRLRPAVMKLALKCLAPKGAPLSMQQVDTELRLLGLLLRQYETNPRRGRVPLAAAAEADAPGETGGAPLVPLGPGSFGQPRAKVKADLQPAGGTCPACASAEIYISRARSPFERLLERWRVPICRCHRCYHRYVVFARLKIAKHLPAESEHGAPTRRRT
jgi:hypothetical protein